MGTVPGLVGRRDVPFGGPLLRLSDPLAATAEPEQALEAERRRHKGPPTMRRPEPADLKGASWPLLDQTTGMHPLHCSPPRRNAASASTTWR